MMLRLDKFERYPLTFGPSPIEHLPRMTAALGGKVHIYAKRDDCNSGLAMGGNKLRKLEYIVPDAIASNADTLVSIGGVQSNHTRLVAATAAKIGMKCVVIQESWVPHEDAVYDRVGNIQMTRLMGRTAGSSPTVLTSEFARAGKTPFNRSKTLAGNHTASRPARRCTSLAVLAMWVSQKRFAPRKSRWELNSTTS
jgi:1-aminocyclopropane-1-carboxylate deaminase/D-cysteine desulfhydrase-like pyridoxal-dependent ACC family enzyme